MNPFSRLCTSLAVVLAAFVFEAGVSVPAALALPGAGLIKSLPIAPLANKSVITEESRREGLVKKVGLRLRITYGGYGYPGGIYRYGRHRNYSGYNRRYVPSYRYRSYRAYPRYRTRRHYRTRRYGRRHLRRHRLLRRFLRRRFR